MEFRKPSLDEMRLINFLVRKAKNLNMPKNISKDIMVASMDDGGMGSLRIFPDGVELPNAVFGNQVSAC